MRERAARVAGFLGVGFLPDADGVLITDSTSAYETVALAAHFEAFRLYGLRARGASGRDRLPAPPGLSFVSLGTVRSGKDLYRSAPGIARRILRSCRHDPWDVAVIFETGLVPLLALAACAITRRPAVAAIRGDSAGTARTAFRYRSGYRRGVGLGLSSLHRISQWAAARTVPVIVDSQEMAERIRSWGGLSRVIPAASVSVQDLLSNRDFWPGPAHRPLRLLWVGRFERVKGLEHLIRAVALASAKGAAVELELIGAGDSGYRSEIDRLTDVHSLDSRVVLAGPIPHGPHLFARYARADLFVLPSISEGTPKVVSEAFAHGLPVVAAAVGNLPRLIRPGLGALVPPADPEALAGQILAYGADPARVRREGEQCLREARTLTLEAVTTRLAAAVGDASPPRWIRRSTSR